MSFQLHEDMVLVQKAHKLVLEIYGVTRKFPKEEAFGLTSQMRRAAVSIPANVCEGKGRGSDRELYRFLMIARASLNELSYFLLLCKDIAYIDLSEYTRLVTIANEVGRIMTGVISFLRKRLVPSLSSKASRLKPKA